MPIPELGDGYYLPPGEHSCSIDEIGARFGSRNPQRQKVWEEFLRCLGFMKAIGICPDVIIIDGSFVTGRDHPSDVDVAVRVPVEKMAQAMSAADEETKEYIRLFAAMGAGSLEAQRLVKRVFGAHVQFALEDNRLGQWSRFFSMVKEPDPKKDPPDVPRPDEKGILRVEMRGDVA